MNLIIGTPDEWRHYGGLRQIGFDGSPDRFPSPRTIVDEDWSRDQRTETLNYLQRGSFFSRSGGMEECQGCGEKQWGISEWTDGEFVWSDQLTHDVRRHNVVPAAEFIEWAFSNAAEARRRPFLEQRPERIADVGVSEQAVGGLFNDARRATIHGRGAERWTRPFAVGTMPDEVAHVRSHLSSLFRDGSGRREAHVLLANREDREFPVVRIQLWTATDHRGEVIVQLPFRVGSHGYLENSFDPGATSPGTLVVRDWNLAESLVADVVVPEEFLAWASTMNFIPAATAALEQHGAALEVLRHAAPAPLIDILPPTPELLALVPKLLWPMNVESEPRSALVRRLWAELRHTHRDDQELLRTLLRWYGSAYAPTLGEACRQQEPLFFPLLGSVSRKAPAVAVEGIGASDPAVLGAARYYTEICHEAEAARPYVPASTRAKLKEAGSLGGGRELPGLLEYVLGP